MERDGRKAIRAALYARVSTAGRGQDVELQLEELRHTAAQRGWQTVDEYVDHGVSGSQEFRPGLDRMLDDAGKGMLDVILVWKIDRLGRSLRHLLSVLDEFSRLGVQFASLRDPGIDTTVPTGRLLLHLIGAFAEFERALIQERVQAGVQRARLAGRHCGRPRVEMDLRAATILLEQGRALREVAAMLQVPRTTLRRRLMEEGWSGERKVVQKSALPSPGKSLS